MSTKFSIKRQFAVFVGALLMSSIAVGAAVAPGAAPTSPFAVAVTYA